MNLPARQPNPRQRMRDRKRERMQRALKQHQWFEQVPSQILGGLAELLLVSRELRARIQAEGIMRADGTIHPAVEALRKYKHTELGYLQAVAEMRHAEESSGPRDIVEAIARVTEN